MFFFNIVNFKKKKTTFSPPILLGRLLGVECLDVSPPPPPPPELDEIAAGDEELRALDELTPPLLSPLS